MSSLIPVWELVLLTILLVVAFFGFILVFKNWREYLLKVAILLIAVSFPLAILFSILYTFDPSPTYELLFTFFEVPTLISILVIGANLFWDLIKTKKEATS